MPKCNWVRLAASCLAISVPSAGMALQSGGGSQPVVQALPNEDSVTLNSALARLGRNPRDIDALLDAGNAALGIGDVDAAIGFFSRADQVMPGDARVKAGLASALVRNGNPVAALPLFDEAERGGAKGTMILLDRGLAFDLVGDNVSAQRLYRQILGSGNSDEAVRRLGLSQAISGDKRGSAATLTPLLQRQDKAAWRSRAFALAILGQTDDAVAVVNSSLPADLAQRISPYLRYMPRLTKSQQAAAANFGQFPRASEIGLDDPAIAAYAASARRTGVAAADTGLIPKGEPLGRNARGRSPNDQDNPGPRLAQADPASLRRTAPPDPMPGRNTVPAPLLTSPGRATPLAAKPPAPAAPAPAPVAAQLPPVSPQPVRVAAVAPPVIAPQPALPSARMSTVAAGPPPIQVPAASSPAAAPVPAPVAPAAEPPPPPPAPKPRRPSLSEAFGDFSKPAIDAAPAAGAVDLRRIRPAREADPAAAGAKGKPGQEKPAAKPSHPSRIWVQVATGRDKSGLAYDWRRMVKDADAAFKGKRPWVSAWNQTNRLLTGPFESESAANAFMAQLRRANITGSFLWTSPAGQIVDSLASR